jgi:hypothetical protein
VRARLPMVLELAASRGHLVFSEPRSANLVVQRGPGKPGDWDGLLTLSYRDAPGAGWTSYAWPCATRPGAPYLTQPMNPKGTAVIEPGQYRLSHRRGLHHGRPALVQVRPVTVRRDPNRNTALDAGGPLDTGLFGVNIHDVQHPHQLAGCVGLSSAHLVDLLDVFEGLEPHQGPDVSLTVVEG